jgi:xanthine dehydrogenase YagT iron-sulfur-binding subunit
MSSEQTMPTDRPPPFDTHDGQQNAFALSRRSMLQGGSAVIAAGPLASCAVTNQSASSQAVLLPFPPDHAVTVQATINRQRVAVQIDPRTSLLDLLRERLALTGAKKGCDHGQCGACTVHVDGRPVAACLTLAAKIDGKTVLTIEGLPNGEQSGEQLHPMQQAFIDHDALQCGYCTPGQIMAAVACVADGNATSRERIRECMSGNICRCGAYVGIVAAIEEVAQKMGRS